MSIHHLLAVIARDYKKFARMDITRSTTPTQRKSNKSKLKMTKGKPKAGVYKSSKPVKSKSVTQFRNKSNI